MSYAPPSAIGSFARQRRSHQRQTNQNRGVVPHAAPSDRALKEIADDEVVMGSRQNTWQPAKWIRCASGKEMAGENVSQHAAISLGHSDS